MDYFDFIGLVEYSKAKLHLVGIKPNEILINNLNLKGYQKLVTTEISKVESICGLKVLYTDELKPNDFKILMPKY